MDDRACDVAGYAGDVDADGTVGEVSLSAHPEPSRLDHLLLRGHVQGQRPGAILAKGVLCQTGMQRLVHPSHVATEPAFEVIEEAAPDRGRVLGADRLVDRLRLPGHLD